MVFRDRYTRLFVLIGLSSAATIYLFKQSKNEYIPLPGLVLSISVLILMYMMWKGSARIHLYENHSGIDYKGEHDCGFNPTPTEALDGIRLRGRRYKLVNGSDVYINSADEIKPCGPGTALMQWIGGGGPEPQSI